MRWVVPLNGIIINEDRRPSPSPPFIHQSVLARSLADQRLISLVSYLLTHLLKYSPTHSLSRLLTYLLTHSLSRFASLHSHSAAEAVDNNGRQQQRRRRSEQTDAN
eukprot:GHVU01189171.1.p1 GENE.GHVU01189171.1~~GHVU01189171.1.p1  ORF type:complete len:106 (+),score=3.51 GHVU01189171.1:261-578(+)